jgi:3-hydroxyacyl-CoA dehydrogenase
VFENFNLKRSVFEEAETYASKDVILASSTGNIFPSRLAEGMKLKDRIIVSHPVRLFYFYSLIHPLLLVHIIVYTMKFITSTIFKRM